MIASSLIFAGCVAHAGNNQNLCNLLVTDVDAIPVYADALLTPENIESYIEVPLIPAILEMLRKNISTSSSSANKNDLQSENRYFYDGKAYSRLAFWFTGLSKENQKILFGLFSKSLDDARIGRPWSYGGPDIDHPSSLGGGNEVTTAVREDPENHSRLVIVEDLLAISAYVYIPLDRTMTVGDLSQRWEKLSRAFAPQERMGPSSHLTEQEADERMMKMFERLLKK